MYITLTLNPALDVSVSAVNPAPGLLNVTDASSISCGGKGINVSRALRVMGEDSTAYALLGGEPGRILAGMASREGVALSVTRTAAPTRINVKVISEGGARQTELNGRGGPVSSSELEALFGSISADLDRVGNSESVTAVLSGSIPQGVEKSVYNSLAQMLKDRGARVVVDASGEALIQAVRARPWLVKPNRGELEGLVGKSIADFGQLVETACGFYRETGTAVLATCGGDGAVYAGDDGVWTVDAPKITMKSFAGAGDTFLAAFLYRLRDGVGDALRFAASAAAAKVELEGTAMPASPAEMGKYASSLTAKRLS
ncbi:MAG: hexose kinase [Clostridia bacterium]|nr:hexose kinase [Clostridia bacterium]MCR5264340.1 hexose kinase [Clostridiales bacterium]